MNRCIHDLDRLVGILEALPMFFDSSIERKLDARKPSWVIGIIVWFLVYQSIKVLN